MLIEDLNKAFAGSPNSPGAEIAKKLFAPNEMQSVSIGAVEATA